MRYASYGSIVGQILAKRRVVQGVGQSDIAKKTGIKQSVISRMENGNIAISVTQLARWASALDTSLPEVFRMADQAVIALQGRHGVRVLYQRPSVVKRRKGLLKGSEVGALLALSL